MLIKVCDRCGVVVEAVPASVTVALALDAPATKPKAVTADPFTATFGVQLFADTPDRPVDLCAICRASAVTELLVASVTGAGLGPKAVQRLLARLAEALPGLATKDAGAA